MYKLVCIDLDETFLDYQHTIPQRNIDAIKKARALGVKVVINTGRPVTSAFDVMKKAGLDQEGDYMINCNGAVIYDTYREEIISLHPLPTPIAKILVDKANDLNVTANVMTVNHNYMFNIHRSINHFQSPIRKEVSSFDEVTDFPIIKVLLEANHDLPFEELLALEKEVNELVDHKATISFSSNKFLECNDLNIDKGEGMLLLARHLGIKQEETIAIGDNFNDVSMLEKAGLSVAVRNAREEIIPFVDVVTEADCAQGAVGEVIETYILNQSIESK